MRFKKRQLVMHVKTGNVYRIVYTPVHCRIEETNAPAYAYRRADEKTGDLTLWVRAQDVMEDGRFVEVAP